MCIFLNLIFCFGVWSQTDGSLHLKLIHRPKMKIILAVLVAQFLLAESKNCYRPLFHCQTPEIMVFTESYGNYHTKDKTLTLYIPSEISRKGAPKTRVFASTNFLDWKEVTDKKIPVGKYPVDNRLLYVADDKYNSTKLFQGMTGDVYSFYSRDTKAYDVFTDLNGMIKEVCETCAKLDGIPADWISPVYDKPLNTWISLNDTHFYTSKDLKSWSLSHPLFYENSDSDLAFIEDIFSISVTGDSKTVKWVAVCSDFTEKFYYVFDFGEDSVKLVTKKRVTFDYGPDLEEVAVLNGYEYGLSEISFVGTISLKKSKEEQDENKVAVIQDRKDKILKAGCWGVVSSFVRTVKLYKNSEKNYRLKMFPYKVAEDKPGKLFSFLNLDFESVDALKDVKGKYFKLSVSLSPTTATKYGFEIFKGKYTEAKIYHDVKKKSICFDRSNSVKIPLSFYDLKFYKNVYCAPVSSQFILYADGSICEVFETSGEFSATFTVFSEDDGVQMVPFSDGKATAPDLKIILFTEKWS